MTSGRCQKFRERTSIRLPEMSLHRDAVADLAFVATFMNRRRHEDPSRSRVRATRENTGRPKKNREISRGGRSRDTQRHARLRLDLANASSTHARVATAASYAKLANYVKMARLRHSCDEDDPFRILISTK